MSRPLPLLLPLALIGLMLAGVALGASSMPPDRLLAALLGQGSRADGIIVWTLRMPRVLLAVLAGAALAIAGLLMQRATRNPLAAPSVLGVVDGGALGVLSFLWLFSDASNALTVSIHWRPLAAALGAGLFASLVGLLALRDHAGPRRLLLYGVAMAALAHALVVLMMLAGPVYQASQALLWLAGSVAQAEWRDVITLAICLAGGVLLLVPLLQPLDQLRLDDDSAAGTGLRVGAARLAALALAVGLTAAAVSVAGGIGFVGLIAPHAARLIAGSRGLPQLVCAALIGAAMVMAADLSVRLAFAPLEVPTGALTALIGAPYFLALLIRGARAHA